MVEYVTPSKEAFHCRKIFHSSQRDQGETNAEWFNRVIESLKDCEYLELSEFMLMDKFLTGLDKELFEQFTTEYPTLTSDKMPLILSDNDKNYRSSEASSSQQVLHADDFAHFLAVDVDIKVVVHQYRESF